MDLKCLTLAAVFLVFGGLEMLSQTGKSSMGSGCRTGNLREEAANTVVAITSFLGELQDAVKKDNREIVAKLISYPLLVSMPSGKLHVRSEEEFLGSYRKIFPEKLIRLLLEQKAECISRVGAQGFTIGNGQIWFDVFPDGKVRVFTITPVVLRNE